MPKLICDIVTPVGKLYSAEAHMVVVPGVEGHLGFLANREPLVTVLADGIARIQPEKDGEMLRFVVQGGYVEVTGKKVIILADRACSAKDVDLQATQQKLKELKLRLADLSKEEASKTTIDTDISWCKMKIEAAEA